MSSTRSDYLTHQSYEIFEFVAQKEDTLTKARQYRSGSDAPTPQPGAAAGSGMWKRVDYDTKKPLNYEFIMALLYLFRYLDTC